MHDGSMQTLLEVVEWYNFGGRFSLDAPVTSIFGRWYKTAESK